MTVSELIKEKIIRGTGILTVAAVLLASASCYSVKKEEGASGRAPFEENTTAFPDSESAESSEAPSGVPPQTAERDTEEPASTDALQTGTPDEPEPVPVIGELPDSSAEMSKDLAARLLSFCDTRSRSGMTRLMNDISFDVVLTGNYDKTDEDISHTSAYTVGKRTYEGKNYYLIVIRSTNRGEWYSNFDFAPSHSNETLYAENFYLAAADIFDSVKGILDGDPDRNVIVCGHSRGGSTANLFGVMLDEEYGEENVYVYTYATPMTVRGEAAERRYGNIFNFVNMNDVVTHLPPGRYGYGRAGKDIAMSAPSSVKSVLDFFNKLYDLAPDIRSYYEVRYSLEGQGISDDGMSVYDVMCVFAGYLAYGRLNIPDFTFSFLASELFPVFLKMASVFGTARSAVGPEHEVAKYSELIDAL
ncbi:MAG: lipase family protein [Clostridia bacterium]|nr:lipase family protein [Clostridia bacterium]